jgi:ribonuclease T
LIGTVFYSEKSNHCIKEENSLPPKHKNNMATRFRGLLPIVVDVETSGLQPETDALLEIAFVIIAMDKQGQLYPKTVQAYHVEPFIGARLDAKALAVTGIDPSYPLRYAVPEQHALHHVFSTVKQAVEEARCQRAVLVGHNSWFDLAFINAAVGRCRLTSNPFHSFTSLDTASLAALALGETVLARAVRAGGFTFDVNKAHSAIYDVERTAELFCYIVNHTRLS